MTSPGEAIAEKFAAARHVLGMLPEGGLQVYRELIAAIEGHDKYRMVDDMLSGLTAQGKLQAIDQVLARYGRQ